MAAIKQSNNQTIKQSNNQTKDIPFSELTDGFTVCTSFLFQFISEFLFQFACIAQQLLGVRIDLRTGAQNDSARRWCTVRYTTLIRAGVGVGVSVASVSWFVTQIWWCGTAVGLTGLRWYGAATKRVRWGVMR